MPYLTKMVKLQTIRDIAYENFVGNLMCVLHGFSPAKLPITTSVT